LEELLVSEISESGVGNEPLGIMTRNIGLKNIKKISLSNSNITENGAMFIENDAKWKRLEELNL